jgi:acyl-CoA synthetase (AMP-forming)/AMP-acid ligase II
MCRNSRTELWSIIDRKLRGMKMINYTILHILANNAKSFHEKTAVIEGIGGRYITFGELWRRIFNFSAILQQNGMKFGERVIIRVTQSIDCLVAIYGVQLAGGTVIPVETNLVEGKMKELLEYFESRILISTQPVEFDGTFFALQEVLLAPESFEQPNFPKADDLAFIIHTTGTTGKSKGVKLTFRNRLMGADNQSVEIALSFSDTGLVSQPFSHSGGLRRCDALFIYSGTVVLMNGLGAIGTFYQALTQYHVTILWLVPAQLSLILMRGEKQLTALGRQLRVVIFESAKPLECQKETLRKILPHVRLYVNYSSTEATGTCHFEYSAFSPMQDCVGKGVTPHSKVLFVDDDGNEIEATKDNPAIIASEGGSVALGYWKEPELTAKIFKNGRVISADIGYKDENGFIYVIGRRDDIIISGGNKISPSEIEEVVMQIAGIRECACIPVPDEALGFVPKLFVVIENGMKFSPKDIMKHLSRKIELYKVPQQIDCIDELPRVGVGKISRKSFIDMSTQRRMENK